MKIISNIEKLSSQFKITFNCIKMAKRMTKKARSAETDIILQEIKEGILEIVHVQGISPVWKKFSKILNAKTKLSAGYVQCGECRNLVTFNKMSGSSNLLKHKCGIVPDQVYNIIPVEKLANIRNDIMLASVSFCAIDMKPPEVLCGPGFLKFAQSLITACGKYGNIDVNEIIPNVNAVKRKTSEMKEETNQLVLHDFKQAFERGWCSATLEVWNYSAMVDDPSLLTFSLQYFDSNLTGLYKKTIFTIGIDEADSPDKTWQRIIYQFKIFGGEESQLQQMKIVTPKNSFTDGLTCLANVKNCAANKINSILEMARDSSSEEILTACRSIVSYLADSGKVHQLKSDLQYDSGTWPSRIAMIESIIGQYEDVMKILDDEKRSSFVLNKRKAEELVSFLTPFLEAIEDLLSTSYTTANKVVLWWAMLSSHFQKSETYSLGMKQLALRVKSMFDTEFYPTIDHKIDCFLDPRYRCLKMFGETERVAVYSEVRRLLQNIPEAEVTNNSENSSAANCTLPKKKSRFEKYETTEGDIDINDEVKMYIHSSEVRKIDFDSEFNVIGVFWKQSQTKYPKLFQLATNRLHVATCCGEIEEIGQMELQSKFEHEDLNNLIMLRNDFVSKGNVKM